MLKTVKALILRAAGVNCDRETFHAFEAAGARASFAHINRFIRGEDRMDRYHIMAVPGGFSFGDDIAAGRILGNEFAYLVADQVSRFTAEGKLVIGICNGFQVLIKSGLLPGCAAGIGVPALQQKITSARAGAQRGGAAVAERQLPPQTATVFDNDSGKFECRWTHLRRAGGDTCVFTRGMPDIITLPVAHGEGKVMFQDESVRRGVWDNNQVVFQYVDENGRFGGYPINPNGSTDHIAGLCDPTGRIFGLMPHPERYARTFHHPRWTRENAPAEPHGAMVFRNAVKFAKKHL